MNPAEAAAVEYEEPDWLERFNEQCARWPRLPRYLQEDAAFEEVMRQWRRFHAEPAEVGKRIPRPASEAMIALAKLKIMPPRSAWNEIPHGGDVGYQHDDHMWMSYASEQWRITAIEDRMLHLEKMSFDDKTETKQIDLNRARWDKYTEAAVAVLEAMRAPSNANH
jgi:hypothetical protein